MHTYCVVLRPQQSLNRLYPQTKRYYLRANSVRKQCLSHRRILNGSYVGLSLRACLLAHHKVNIQCLQRIRS